MKSSVLTAMFALAGAALILSAPADAAVFTPDQGVLRDQAGAAIIQVQRGQRQQRVINRRVSRPALRATPNRALRKGVPGRATIRKAGPGRAFAPGRAVGPRRAAVIHRRGFRPAGYRRWHPRHLVVRRWYHRPYYGRIIGGVAIGTLLAASAYYVYAAEPPAPGLCWFWADDEETQGYWDYCIDPQ